MRVRAFSSDDFVAGYLESEKMRVRANSLKSEKVRVRALSSVSKMICV